MQQFKIFLLLICTLTLSCGAENKKVEQYYLSNPELHQQIADSLREFCREHKTELVLRKYSDTILSFQILIDSESTYYPIYYTSNLERQDPDPEKTSGFNPPLSALAAYLSSSYIALSSDSVQTFFAGAWNVKMQLGTQGDSQFGVLISSNSSHLENCIERLDSNACFTIGVVQ